MKKEGTTPQLLISYSDPFQRTFKHLIQSRWLTWYDLTPPAVSVFPVTLPSTLAHRIQAYIRLHTQPLLQSRACNRLSLPPKVYKIHLGGHFFHKNSLQQYFSAKTKGYNQFLRLIPKNDLQCQSFTNAVTHQQHTVQA